MKDKLTRTQSDTLVFRGVYSERKIYPNNDMSDGYAIFEITDLLKILPKQIEKEVFDEKVRFDLTIEWRSESNLWYAGYTEHGMTQNYWIDTELIDALFHLVLVLVKNGYIQTEKNRNMKIDVNFSGGFVLNVDDNMDDSAIQEMIDRLEREMSGALSRVAYANDLGNVIFELQSE